MLVFANTDTSVAMKLIKLEKDNAITCFSKWFADDIELKAKNFLKKKETTLSGVVAKDFHTLSLNYSDNAINEIRDVFFEISNAEQKIYYYYFGYYEYKDRFLKSGILFKLEQDNPTIIYVPEMTIFYQTLLEKFKTNTQTDERNSMFALFKFCILKLKKEYSPEYLSIDPASPGSQRIIMKLWKSADVFSGEIQLPMEEICSECRLNSSIYTFEKVGGSFCSKRCAKKHWIKISRYIRFKIK